MLELIFIIPVFLGVITLFLPRTAGRFLLILTGVFHLTFTASIWLTGVTSYWAPYFGVAPEGRIVLLVTSFLYMFIAAYTVSYMAEVEMHNEPVFAGAMLLFLGAMSMVAVTDHLIVLWIAIEATTLMSAPLIFLHKSKEALEATWKYVLICSVGIALALLGVFFIILAIDAGDINAPVTFTYLARTSGKFDPAWLKAGFIFILIGYGTKMGLAPMHTWLPDAHSEAPSPVSALLSGALLNCAFLGIYKTHGIMQAAGLGWYSGRILVVFGLVSMLVAAVFIMQQDNYKRLLAYSSIENMGVIAFGTGIGGLAAYGAMLHLIHHALIKSSLFLTSGNILLGFGSKKIKETGRMPRLMPRTFVSFMGGFAGISGFPPFGIFVSEMLIIFGALKKGAYISLSVFIISLILVFAGASKGIIRMSFGSFNGELLVGEKFLRLAPPCILLLVSAGLSIWMPDTLYQTILKAVSTIGGGING
jgi:hydrogenase-4 component F